MRFVSKATAPLIWRTVAFIGIFGILSGVLGSQIIAGGIVNRDGFAIYGGLGKAMIFGVIAFLLVIRGHRAVGLEEWRRQLFGWLLLSILCGLAAWQGIQMLLIQQSTAAMFLVHTSIVVAIACAFLGVFGLPNTRRLVRGYQKELWQAAGIAAGFYMLLQLVYSLWRPLAGVVIHSVAWLLSSSHVPVDIIASNVLITDKFGVTVAQYCSGVESIALFSGLYAVVGLLDRPRLNVRRYIGVFPIALLGLFLLNIIRVYALIAAGYYYNPEIAFSLFHSYAGTLFFVLYSIAFWAVAYRYITNRSIKPVPDSRGGTGGDPQRVLISHVYSSDNKGDAALTSVLIADIRRIFPTATITIASLEGTSGQTFEGVPVETSFMAYALSGYRNNIAKLAYTAYMVPATMLWAVLYRLTKHDMWLPSHIRRVTRLYANADLIVPVGGGYLRSRPGLRNRLNVPLLLHPLIIGRLLQKPTVLYAQSVGPFQNRAEEQLVAWVLRRMSCILLREDRSLELLRKLGVHRGVHRAVDSGFLLQSTAPSRVREQYHIPKNKRLLGVTVRSWLSGRAQQRYEKAVASALDVFIKEYDAHVIFIPQVTAAKGDDDRIVARRVQKAMRRKKNVTVVEETPDHHAIKTMYDGLDILLGTRFHSVIFSLTSLVPVVAIEYEHKTSGIMHDLALDKWVLPIEEVTRDKLLLLLRNVVTDYQAYQAILRKRVPPYQDEARQTAEHLRETYQQAIL